MKSISSSELAFLLLGMVLLRDDGILILMGGFILFKFFGVVVGRD